MFNFGAFAGGLSQGIQAGQKIALEQEQLEASRNKAAEAMKREEADAINRVAKNVGTHNKDMSELTIKMNKAETEQEYNTYASELNSAIDSFSGLAQAEAKSGLLPKTASDIYSNARLQGVEPIETVTIKNYKDEEVSVSIPKSMAENKDSISLMENGKIGIAQMGDDGKIAGYQPTDISPNKFKAPEVKGTLAVINGKEGFYTNDELFNATSKGADVERSKDKPAVNTSTTKVTVLGEDKPIEIADEYGTFFANKDTGEAILNSKGKKVYSKLGDKTSKVIEGLDTSKRTVSALDNMVKILDKNPEAVGSLGENPYEFVSNYANDFIGIPTKELVNRNTIDGMGGVIAAMIRNTNESGVMTKDDVERYQKLIPKSGDSEIVFRNKVKTLTADMRNTIKRQEGRYSKELPNFVKDDNESAITPYEEGKDKPRDNKPIQVGSANGLPVFKDSKGEYIEVNGVKKYKGAK